MRGETIRAGAFIGALLSAAAPARVRAATFAVTKTTDAADGECDADCSLREAVIAANDAPGSTILVPAGLYRLSIAGAEEDAAATGDLDLLVDMTIEGAGAGATVIDARPSSGVGVSGVDRVFDARGGAVLLRGMTISGGHRFSSEVFAPDPAYAGAGARSVGADLTVEDSAVTDNRAYNGAGLGVLGASSRLTVRRTEVFGNFSRGGGTGVYAEGGSQTLIEECWIHHNAIGVTLGDDFAGVGLAVIGAGTRADVVRTTISENTDSSTAPNLGGGVYASGVVTLTNSTVAGNAVESAGESGGAFLDAVGPATDSRLEIVHTTIAGHRGSTVANQVRGRNLQAGSIVLANSIFADAGRPDAPDLPACFFEGAQDGVLSLGGNLDDDGSCGLTDPSDSPNTDPLLTPYAIEDPMKLPIADHGGPTPTWALTAESPAVDMGALAQCEALDQRGWDRVAVCDIGAYEFGAMEPIPPCSRLFQAQATLDADVLEDVGTAGEAVTCLRNVAGL